MDEKTWLSFIYGCAIGFDLDSYQVEKILEDVGLSANSSLIECQKAIRANIGEERWENGIRLIRARMRPAEFN